MSERNMRGRIIAHGVFWLPTAYAFLAVIVSVLQTLYGDAPLDCSNSATALRDELDSEVARALADPANDIRWAKFEQEYQIRLKDLESQCDAPALPDALRSTFQESRGIVQKSFELAAGPRQALDRLLSPD
ncbi:MAG: hypothetical protein AAF654_14790 [Myxococcota bacterium]